MMKSYHTVLTIFILFTFLTFFSCSKVGKEENRIFRNPIIPGFNPDPSVCRVGEDYYLITSTFEYFPGVPIYHSRDLVNWKNIGHVLNRPEQLFLDSVKSTAGIFAPTIRYNNGTFYMITTLVHHGPVERKGNFIVTAKKPEGPWSNPHWIDDAPGIDPSLFFDDDGRVYYCGNDNPDSSYFRAHKLIWMQELDTATWQLKGKRTTLDAKPYYDSGEIGSVVAFEAPHIYKKDDIYYLLIAHGGTGMGHAVSLWNSKSPLGPWKENPANPVLTHRGFTESGINCTGHADIFQTQHGDWWSVFLAVRSDDGKRNPMGRETFLCPVDWSGEWPVYNPEGDTGKVAFEMKAPDLPQGDPIDRYYFKDSFDQEALNLSWAMIRTPAEQWWDLKTEPGKMRIKLRPEEFEEYSQPSFLGHRVFSPKIQATAAVTFVPKKPEECAGIALERGHQPDWSLVIELDQDNLVVSAYEGTALIASQPISSTENIELSIKLIDFNISFWVKEPKGDWQKIAQADGNELGFPPAGRFTGAFMGIYASSRGNKSDNIASYDWFEIKKIDQSIQND